MEFNQIHPLPIPTPSKIVQTNKNELWKWDFISNVNNWGGGVDHCSHQNKMLINMNCVIVLLLLLPLLLVALLLFYHY